MIEKKRLLLVDDDITFSRGLVVRSSKTDKYSYDVANTFEEAISMIKASKYDAYILDIDLNSSSDGFFLGDFIKTRTPNASIIIISSSSGSDPIGKTLEHRFDHFFTKSTNYDKLIVKIEEILEFSPSSTDKNTIFDFKKYGIITANKEMLSMLSMATRLKNSTNILIEGESGTGKESMARYLGSILAPTGPFVVVNCPAIPNTLMESILFGHAKGAFTGADEKTTGKFEEANGGTIFLDEISCAELDLQKKLLRVIQNQEIEKVGTAKKIKCNVKIIASTNENLQNKILKNEFRQDLFYRLKRHTITLPPLRNRIDDIEPLINHFAEDKKNKFTKEVIAVLKNYFWPGNIRELENLVYDLLIKTENRNKVILKDVLFLFTTNFTKSISTTESEVNEEKIIDYLIEKAEQNGLLSYLKILEQQIITKELQRCKSRSQCSHKLKLDLSGLSKRLKKYNLDE
jgi:DNA-binding NtrC family response regulator